MFAVSAPSRGDTSVEVILRDITQTFKGYVPLESKLRDYYLAGEDKTRNRVYSSWSLNTSLRLRGFDSTRFSVFTHL